MEYRITVTVNTDDVSPAAWPDASIEVQTMVSVLTEAGDEILGRVVGIRYEQVEA